MEALINSDVDHLLELTVYSCIKLSLEKPVQNDIIRVISAS